MPRTLVGRRAAAPGPRVPARETPGSVEDEVGAGDAELPGQAQEQQAPTGSGHDVLGEHLDQRPPLVPGEPGAVRVGTAPRPRGVVGPLVLRDDPVLPPDEVTLEELLPRTVVDHGVELGLRKPRPGHDEAGARLHR